MYLQTILAEGSWQQYRSKAKRLETPSICEKNLFFLSDLTLKLAQYDKWN